MPPPSLSVIKNQVYRFIGFYNLVAENLSFRGCGGIFIYKSKYESLLTLADVSAILPEIEKFTGLCQLVVRLVLGPIRSRAWSFDAVSIEHLFADSLRWVKRVSDPCDSDE